MHNNIVGIAVMAGAVSLLLGLDKGGLGGGLGVLAVPLLSVVLPVQEAVGLLLPVLIIGDVFAVSAHWRRWDMGLIWKVIPGGVLGTIIGTFVLLDTSPLLLRRALGVFIILFIIYRLFVEKRLAASAAYQNRAWHGWLAGTASGVASTVAHSGGPPITVYLLLQEIEPRTFVATSALFFAVLNLVKVPPYLMGGVFAGAPMQLVLVMAPLIPVGVWLGRRLATRVRRDVFDRIILALLVFSAGLLLLLPG